MNKNYEIEKSEYRDEYGKVTSTKYYIKYKTSFLGMTYYKYIKSLQLTGYVECSMVRTEFGSIEDAQEFIKDILCKDKQYDGWSSEVVSNETCGELY